MRTDTDRKLKWSANLEQLEERIVMSADPLGGLLGGSIQHHSFVDDLPALEHQVVANQPPAVEHHAGTELPPTLDHHQQSQADFWIDSDNLQAIEEELGKIEQSLENAHDQSGLSQVRTDYGFDGTGQTVAIIDSGIAYDHFALGGGFGSNYRVVGGWDFTGENDADPYDDGAAGSHGTHVSGIVGASGGAHTGVAPGVDLVGLRVFDDAGDGYFSWVENALQWVHDNRDSFENPITAVNLSLGVASWNSDSIPAWANLENEFNLLKQDGIFISVSAGNSYTSFNSTGLSYPAASQHVVPVASVDDSGLLSYYSQRNSRVIAAPGRGIISTVPDYKGNNNGTTDDYASFSGTSMAAPYVAGASVIIREAMEFVGQTNITQQTIYDHMIATADSFYDSATNANYNRLNLEAAIDALMPTDDYGSSLGTAHNLGTVGSSASMSGAITTLDDVDYFKFTAANTGTVTFTASSMTHNVDANWEVNGGSGTWSGANNETLTVDVVAGQEYTVGFSSDDGLGYYDLDITAESTFSFTDWGSISFTESQGHSNIGDSWYRLEASDAGYLTAEALFDAGGGQISLELYNSSMSLIDSGNAVSGTSRVDAYAAANDEFYLKVSGSNSDIDFRLANLVSIDGTTVSVEGTSANDIFTFSAGSTHELSVNGTVYSFSSVSVNDFQFDGQAGTDTMLMSGTTSGETASVYEGTATLAGSAFSAHSTNTQHIVLNGGGGNDHANFFDSVFNDIYRAWDSRQSMAYGQGGFSEAIGFSTSNAYASAGYDRVVLYDTAGDDTYRGYHDKVTMTGDDYHNYARKFDLNYAYASAGQDRAIMFDSAGDDTYRSFSETRIATMTGAQYFNYARQFEENFAFSTTGNDRAVLEGSVGNDTYRSDAGAKSASLTSANFVSYTKSFSENYAFASSGNDRAIMTDSSAGDTYRTYHNKSTMESADFFSYAGDFDENYGFATSGNDRAIMYDSAGDDVYRTDQYKVTMSGSGFFNYAKSFKETYAFSTSGNDQAIMYDSVGDDTYRAYHNKVTMAGSGYFNYAANFSQTIATTLGGNDTARLYDSAESDLVTASGSFAEITGNGYSNSVHDFDVVDAITSNGGVDTADQGATDYIFNLIGAWS